MADCLSESSSKRLTTPALTRTYGRILQTLADVNISATFAFVGAMTLEREHFVHTWLPRLKASPQHCAWLQRLFEDLDTGKDDGWFQPKLLSMVLAAHVPHEIASHGFTHLPLHRADTQALALEIEGIQDWIATKNIQVDTFVFPRNLVAAIQELNSIGIHGYRCSEHPGGDQSLLDRVFNVAREFSPFCKSQAAEPLSHGVVSVPGNFFLNWRSGVRRLVPISLTVARFAQALRHASAHGGVVHLWLHPHNLITGQRQFELFQRCLDVLANQVGQGKIVTTTQSQYVGAQRQRLDPSLGASVSTSPFARAATAPRVGRAAPRTGHGQGVERSSPRASKARARSSTALDTA